MLRQHGKAEKAPDRRHHARHGARREALVHQPVDEALQVVAVEVMQGLRHGCGELSKPLEIAAVAFQCVIGEPPFDAQVRQIGVDQIVGG